MSLAHQAQFIRGAVGRTGSNIDYLISTLAHLQELGIRERSLERLLTFVGAHVARGEALEHARPPLSASPSNGRRCRCALASGCDLRMRAGSATAVRLAFAGGRQPQKPNAR